MRAAPDPIPWLRAETGLHRIVRDIGAQAGTFLIVPSPVIITFLLPEVFANAFQQPVCFVGSVGFPTVLYLAQSVARQRPHDDVDMVGHDNPGMKIVAFTGEEVHRNRNQIGDLRPAQPALAGASIEVRFHPIGVPRIQLLFFLPRQWTSGCQGLRKDRLALLFEFQNGLARERIGKAKGNKVTCAFPFEVGKFPSKMKARSQTSRVRSGVHNSDRIANQIGQCQSELKKTVATGGMAAGMPPSLARWEACLHFAVEITRRLRELKW